MPSRGWRTGSALPGLPGLGAVVGGHQGFSARLRATERRISIGRPSRCSSRRSPASVGRYFRYLAAKICLLSFGSIQYLSAGCTPLSASMRLRNARIHQIVFQNSPLGAVPLLVRVFLPIQYRATWSSLGLGLRPSVGMHRPSQCTVCAHRRATVADTMPTFIRTETQKWAIAIKDSAAKVD